jgi:hypothetical protein
MPGLVRGIARTAAIAGTATAVSNRVSRRQANRWAAQEQQQYQQAPEPMPAAANTDITSQLRSLGELHQQGILTDEEFAVQKARLLNG